MVIILGCMVCILSFLLVKVLLEVHHIRQQVSVKIAKRQNFTITTDIRVNLFNLLCDEINILYDSMKDAERECATKEKEFKTMLSNIAHDVRTPLTSVQGYLQLLQQTDDEQKNKAYTSIIDQRINDVKRLLEEFFLYSKLLHEDFMPETRKIALYPCLCEILASYYPMFEAEHTEPLLSFEDTNMMVEANPDLLKRVLQNLIINSLWHGNGNLSITQRGNAVCFSNPVASDISIDMEQVFQRFYKGDTSRTKTSSGLGLTIVKRLMELSEGSVRAELQNNHFMIQLIFSQNQ